MIIFVLTFFFIFFFSLVIHGNNIVENNVYSAGYDDVSIQLGLSHMWLKPGIAEGPFELKAKRCILADWDSDWDSTVKKIAANNVFGGLDEDTGKCPGPTGCTVVCRLPSGNGKNIPVFLKRGESQSSPVTFTVDYQVPTLIAVQNSQNKDLTKIDTVGIGHQKHGHVNEDIVVITGTNFGLNPRVSLQSTQLFGERIYASKSSTNIFDTNYICKGRLVPAHDMESGICVYANATIANPPTKCKSENDFTSCNNLPVGTLCGGHQRCFLPVVPPIARSAAPTVWKSGTSLLVGTSSGTVYHFKKKLNDIKYNYVSDIFSSINVGKYASPLAIPLDPKTESDVPDLVVGTGDGTVEVFINTGTSETPIFSNAVVLSLLNQAGEQTFGSDTRLSVAVVRVTNSNLFKDDMIVGNEAGEVWYFKRKQSVGFSSTAYEAGKQATGDCSSSGRTSISYSNDGTDNYLAIIDNSDGSFRWCKMVVNNGLPSVLELTQQDTPPKYQPIQDKEIDDKVIAFDYTNDNVFVGNARGKVHTYDAVDTNPQPLVIMETSSGCHVGALSPSHTCIKVEIPPGIGKNLKLELTSADQSAHQPLHFNQPTLVTLERIKSGTTESPSDIDTRGFSVSDEVVRIKGKNFGASNNLDLADLYQASVGNPPELTMESPGFGWNVKSWLQGSLKLESWNHNTIEFRAPRGDGRNWPMKVNVGGQINDGTLLLSYMKPSIRIISPNSHITSDGRTGARIHHIEVQQTGAAIAYLLEAIPSDHPQFEIGTEIRIFHNNEGTDYDSTYSPMTIDKIIDNSKFSFQARLVRGTGEQANFMSGNFSGGFVFIADLVDIEIRGLNFGSSMLNVSFGSKLNMQSAAWCPSEISSKSNFNSSHCMKRTCDATECMIKFKAPEGVGQGHSVSIIVGGQESTANQPAATFSYLPPVLLGVKQSNKVQDEDHTILRTDGCEENRFVDWDQDKDIAPRCDDPIMLEVHGISLGSSEYPFTLQLDKYTLCNRADLCQGCIGGVTECGWENPVPYPWSADRPVTYLSNSALKRRDDPFVNTFKYFKGHTVVQTIAPTGIGLNLSLFINSGGQKSNNFTMHYDKPDLKRLETMPYNARGQYGWTEELGGVQKFIVPTTILGKYIRRYPVFILVKK